MGKEHKYFKLFINGFIYYKRYGLTRTLKKVIKKIFFRNQLTKQTFTNIEISVKNEKRLFFPVLEFPVTNTPDVTIIVPVFNNFNYTYNCFYSILKYTTNIQYEIILADDCSKDKTKNIYKIFKNIKIITNTNNIGFLKNCNNAAKQAKGRYILFLNNDTQVQKDWLFHLVKLMERDKNIGLAGSKLVFPDGKLQEAGGIIWNDGTALKYGYGSYSDCPEFNYVKEVDYISGASILIRQSIWEQIGGFDEIYSPAYCEDSDLAFKVRKAGYKVVFQPASVVVHFEGISNGTNLLEGQKQYQVVNQKIFYRKWKEVLEKKHFPNGENVFLARDRSRYRKTLLMIDDFVPHFDMNAGAKTIYQYINFFVEFGFNVKFIGNYFLKHERYTTVLEQLGVEILYGLYYSQNWKTWLKTNGQYIDYVFLNRPDTSIIYIDEIKKYTKAKIFYYGHDLHFFRYKRDYELTKNMESLNLSEKYEKYELELIKKSDIAFFPSPVEIDVIKSIDSSLNVKILPPYIYENKGKIERVLKTTKDIMFIGGFNHPPNVDGILWYSEKIAPLIKEKRQDIKTYILGSNITKQIQKLNSENIAIIGYVTDEELEYYYKNCRLSIVPLRYGAGIKGKVIEAMYYQLPVVTTSAGAEGIYRANECLFIKDNAEDFANEIINIYDNLTLLSEASAIQADVIEKCFTRDSVIKTIKDDFDL
jgi:GT2 family glycosyltransferase